MSLWCLQISQKPTKLFPGFLPQPIKRGQIKKIRALYRKNFVGLLGDLKTPKEYFEIN
jgi:hypothetical protein